MPDPATPAPPPCDEEEDSAASLDAGSTNASAGSPGTRRRAPPRAAGPDGGAPQTPARARRPRRPRLQRREAGAEAIPAAGSGAFAIPFVLVPSLAPPGPSTAPGARQRQGQSSVRPLASR